MSDFSADNIRRAALNAGNSTAEIKSADDEARCAELREKILKEYEQRKQQEVLDSAPLRRQRKAARAGIAANRVKWPTLSLSPEGDTLLFGGEAYGLYYAHGSLQIDRTFKVDLRKKGYSSDERREIFEQVNKLVAESSSAGNIFGAPRLK
jgi:hypothetical protein